MNALPPPLLRQCTPCYPRRPPLSGPRDLIAAVTNSGFSASLVQGDAGSHSQSANLERELAYWWVLLPELAYFWVLLP